MVHLDEAEAAPGRASGAGGASGDASDAGYAQRTDKAWRDQLSSAQAANTGLDENDVDALELYGEQAVHNFPDVHNDWSDARARAVRAARIRAIVDISPDSGGLSASLEPSGWNTAYRAGLENALDAVRDSKQTMRRLKTIRQRRKDLDEGVAFGHLEGKTAKEANVEWEKRRLEARDADRRRRVAAADLAAKSRAEARAWRVPGLPSLPDFLKRSSLNAETSLGVEAAARALAAKHGQWIRALDAAGAASSASVAEARDASAEPPARALSDAAAAQPQTPRATASRRDGASPAPSRARLEVGGGSAIPVEGTRACSEGCPSVASFLENLTTLSPTRRAARAKTDRDEDFWARDVRGGDARDADGAIESAEAEMAKLCAAEISSARMLSAGEDRRARRGGPRCITTRVLFYTLDDLDDRRRLEAVSSLSRPSRGSKSGVRRAWRRFPDELRSLRHGGRDVRFQRERREVDVRDDEVGGFVRLDHVVTRLREPTRADRALALVIPFACAFRGELQESHALGGAGQQSRRDEHYANSAPPGRVGRKPNALPHAFGDALSNAIRIVVRSD